MSKRLLFSISAGKAQRLDIEFVLFSIFNRGQNQNSMQCIVLQAVLGVPIKDVMNLSLQQVASKLLNLVQRFHQSQITMIKMVLSCACLYRRTRLQMIDHGCYSLQILNIIDKMFVHVISQMTQHSRKRVQLMLYTVYDLISRKTQRAQWQRELYRLYWINDYSRVHEAVAESLHCLNMFTNTQITDDEYYNCLRYCFYKSEVSPIPLNRY